MEEPTIKIILTTTGVERIQILAKNDTQQKEGFRLLEGINRHIRALDRKLKRMQTSKEVPDLTLVRQ